MLAASYWSLLEPALEMAAGMGSYGEQGEWAFIPVSVGILLGAGFVYAGNMRRLMIQLIQRLRASDCYYYDISADLVISGMEVSSPLHLMTDLSSTPRKKDVDSESPGPNGDGKIKNEWFSNYDNKKNGELRQRLRNGETDIDMQKYDTGTVHEDEKKVLCCIVFKT